eukprot:scaffold52502_cov40-Prasinocladus_malaysianus.AAC.1
MAVTAGAVPTPALLAHVYSFRGKQLPAVQSRSSNRRLARPARAVFCPEKSQKAGVSESYEKKAVAKRTGIKNKPATQSPLSVQTSWNRWDWAAGYRNCQEYPDGYWLEVIEGSLPAELCGTFVRYEYEIYANH